MVRLRMVRLTVLVAIAIGPAGGAQVTRLTTSDSAILARIDGFASEVVGRDGVIDDSLRVAAQEFLNSSDVRTFLKSVREAQWLESMTIKVPDSSKIKTLLPTSDTTRVDMTVTLRGARPAAVSVDNPCSHAVSADTFTISGRAAGYVSLRLSAVCDTLRKVAELTPDTLSWSRSGVVVLTGPKPDTLGPLKMFLSGPKSPESYCRPGTSKRGSETWVSSKTAANVDSSLTELCRLIAGATSGRDRFLEAKVAVTPPPRKTSVDSMAILRRQVRSLSILQAVLAYQLWRKSSTDTIVVCRSFRTSLATTQISELGAITGFDSNGGIAGNLVVPLSSSGILLGGRKVASRSGGIVELGVGTDRSFTSGPGVPVFGIVFYDSDSRHAGVGFMLMPIKWKRLNLGFGVASDGTISAKIGAMPSMRTTTTISGVSGVDCRHDAHSRDKGITLSFEAMPQRVVSPLTQG